MFSSETALLRQTRIHDKNKTSRSGVIKMIPAIGPQDTRIDHNDLNLRAAQQYQLMNAMSEAKQRRRAARSTTRRLSGRRHFRLTPRHTAATPH